MHCIVVAVVKKIEQEVLFHVRIDPLKVSKFHLWRRSRMEDIKTSSLMSQERSDAFMFHIFLSVTSISNISVSHFICILRLDFKYFNFSFHFHFTVRFQMLTVSLPEHDGPNDVGINVGKIAFEPAKQSIISKQHPITWNEITGRRFRVLELSELMARLTIFWFQEQTCKSILEAECVHVQSLLLMVVRNNTMKLVLLLKKPFSSRKKLSQEN